MLRLILAWLVVAGLVVAPFVAPSAAQSAPQAAMSAMEDMPCCPDEPGKQGPVHDGCKDCATMIICALKSLQAVAPSVAQLTLDSNLLTEMAPVSDPRVEDIGSSPPARPPRSLIVAA